jgi:trigger factor
MEGGESKNHPIHLGEGHFVADFEKKLLGIAAGETREFTIEFPADFARRELQGKKAEAKVFAHSVEKRVVPELTDAFAQQVGAFKNLAELKEALKSNLLREREGREHERLHGELAEKLAASASFSRIPDVLIDKEIDRRLDELHGLLKIQQKTLEEYLASRQKTLAQVRGEMQAAAERAVKVGLALRAFSEQQKIEVTAEEVAKQAAEYLRRFASPKEAAKQIDAEDLKENIRNVLRNQKAMVRLEELATITGPGPATSRAGS